MVSCFQDKLYTPPRVAIAHGGNRTLLFLYEAHADMVRSVYNVCHLLCRSRNDDIMVDNGIFTGRNWVLSLPQNLWRWWRWRGVHAVVWRLLYSLRLKGNCCPGIIHREHLGTEMRMCTHLSTLCQKCLTYNAIIKTHRTFLNCLTFLLTFISDFCILEWNNPRDWQFNQTYLQE